MRLMIFLVSIMTVGAAGVSRGLIPVPTQMVQAIRSLGDDPAPVKAVSGGSVDAYNGVLPKIIRGSSLEELGLHGSTVTFPPGSFRSVNSGAGEIAQDGFASSAASQIQQNNSRMQDIPNYARNPHAWHGLPPH